MHAAERSITLDHPAEWAAFAKWLTDLDAGLAPYDTALPPRLAALRDKAALWAQEARADAEKQPETTSQVVAGEPSETMSTREVATRFRCSTANVTALVRSGRLPASKRAGVYRFDVLDVAELERSRTA